MKSLGWQVFVIWECETRSPEKIIMKIEDLISKKEALS
ncbi:DNA mismatch endonuclease Vsr (fragment) [uncultured Spirochaetota bacterium]